MCEPLRLRGPDAGGQWVEAESGVALGHRRLSILDLSPEGAQPMASQCGRYQMVFNGEVYNFADLRSALESRGHRFRGHSDSEVILARITEVGLEKAVAEFVGMFAIALWDRERRELSLARDRLGIKPLYWSEQGGRVYFGSELGALRAHPHFNAEIDASSLAGFFRHNYIAAPRSIYRQTHKLAPGSLLVLRNGAEPQHKTYWSAREHAISGTQSQLKIDAQEAEEGLLELLRSAVQLRMISDVPLGAFLSGGIDSSTVVALMQEAASKPVKTFTIGFEADRFDEARYAREVAAHLGTEHTEERLSEQMALDIIPSLGTMFDEPFADSSQIPTFLVSQIARKHVTVCLSGDGGDELFGGYSRYHIAESLHAKLGKLPRALRGAMAAGMKATPAAVWQALGKLRGERAGGEKAHRLAEMLRFDSDQVLYRELISHWKRPSDLLVGAEEPGTVLLDSGLQQELPEFFERMMLLDTQTYLCDDILTKVDRASMAVSLEARVPLLDHRIYEFAWKLPRDIRVGAAPGKTLLRQILGRYVPREMFERPKQGFAVPVGDWLKGPLRDWAESLLNEEALSQSGLIRPEPVQQVWQDHLSGRRDRHHYLWDVLMFQSWFKA